MVALKPLTITLTRAMPPAATAMLTTAPATAPLLAEATWSIQW